MGAVNTVNYRVYQPEHLSLLICQTTLIIIPDHFFKNIFLKRAIRILLGFLHREEPLEQSPALVDLIARGACYLFLRHFRAFHKFPLGLDFFKSLRVK